MIYRHQARMCLKLCTFSGMPDKIFLKLDDRITPGPLIKISNLPDINLFHSFLSNDELLTATAMQVPKIIASGTEYCKGSIILLKCTEDILPIFGQMREIYVLENGTKLLLVSEMETVYYEHKLNAYNVLDETRNVPTLQNLQSLIFPHPLSLYIVNQLMFVPLINHERVEFIE